MLISLQKEKVYSAEGCKFEWLEHLGVVISYAKGESTEVFKGGRVNQSGVVSWIIGSFSDVCTRGESLGPEG